MGEINTVRGKWRLRGLSAVRETADSSDFEQIKGMLPHAGLPVLGNADCSVASLGRPSVTQIVTDFGVLAHAGYWKFGGLIFGEGLHPTPLHPQARLRRAWYDG